MSREILVDTPENIQIEYELAGLGSRLLAYLVDLMAQIAIYVGMSVIAVLLFLLINLSSSAGARAVTDFMSHVVRAAAIVTGFLIYWAYFIWLETVWNGQTPGKRQQGLRVIRDGGYPINVFGATIRNLMRVIEGPIGLGLLMAGSATSSPALAAAGGALILVPLCCILFSSRYQRLGDLVAGTMVVKQRAPRVPTLEALAPAPRVLPEHLAPYALADIGRHVYEMTVPEYRAVRHYIDRRWQLPAPIQQTAAMRLAVPLMQRLGITAPPGVLRINYADFLEYLAVAFEQYRGVK